MAPKRRSTADAAPTRPQSRRRAATPRQAPQAAPAAPPQQQQETAFTVHMVVKLPSGDTFSPDSRWRFNVRLPTDKDTEWEAWVREKFRHHHLQLSTPLKLMVVDWLVFTTLCSTWKRFTREGAEGPDADARFPHITSRKGRLNLVDIRSTHALSVLHGTIKQSLDERADWLSSPRNHIVIVDHIILPGRARIPQQIQLPHEFRGTVVNQAGVGQADPDGVLPPQLMAQPSYSSKERRGLESPSGAQFRPDAPYVADLHGEAEVSAFTNLREGSQGQPVWLITDTHLRKDVEDIRLGSASDLDDDELASQMYPSSAMLTRVLQLEEAVCCVIGPAGLGTGFLISPTHLMTCYHCLYNINTRDEKTKYFLPPDGSFRCDFSSTIPLPDPDRPDEPAASGDGMVVEFSVNDIVYPSDHRQRSSVGFDVAIVKLPADRSTSHRFIPLFQSDSDWYEFLDTSRLRRAIQQQTHIIHYPRFQHMADEKVQRTINVYQTTNIIGFGNWEMFYQAATTKGSSGGLIVSIDGRLLGMHRRSGANHTVHADGSAGARLAQRAFFNAALRIDLFLRDSGFSFENLPIPLLTLSHQYPLVDMAIPHLRGTLLELYRDKILVDKLAILPDDCEPADNGKMEIDEGQNEADELSKKDGGCARCLRVLPSESRVVCTRCVRTWCFNCLVIKADDARPQNWTCNAVGTRCTGRTVPIKA